MIYGYCHTNIDESRQHIWPSCFAAIPLIGHRVLAIEARGSKGKVGSNLKVVGITHYYNKTENRPEIKVELNM